jgi:hypothetical protein
MRMLYGLAVVLLFLAVGASASGEAPGAISTEAARCAHRATNLTALTGIKDPLASVFAPKPRATTLTDDCLPPDQSCFYYATGDCLDCWDDNGQRGTYICDSWRCAPSGALYTCCSACSRFSC